MLAMVMGITVAWWALALWPVGDAPAWLERTRSVCFGTRFNGLPDAAGWTALILQPALMIGAITVIWGRSLLVGFATLRERRVGRVILRAVAAGLVVAASAATWRVANAVTSQVPIALDEESLALTASPRIDRRAPPMGLIDQHGDTLDLATLRGQVTLVTFAFAHCETVCPAIVHNVLAAKRALEGSLAVGAVIVTLDPWRDVPSRLPHIARTWGLADGEYVLSGSVESVERTLQAWGVPSRRDTRTGDIIHPALVYLIDANGRIGYRTGGGITSIITLVTRL